jgi:hypothetical protein
MFCSKLQPLVNIAEIILSLASPDNVKKVLFGPFREMSESSGVTGRILSFTIHLALLNVAVFLCISPVPSTK